MRLSFGGGRQQARPSHAASYSAAGSQTIPPEVFRRSVPCETGHGGLGGVFALWLVRCASVTTGYRIVARPHGGVGRVTPARWGGRRSRSHRYRQAVRSRTRSRGRSQLTEFFVLGAPQSPGHGIRWRNPTTAERVRRGA